MIQLSIYFAKISKNKVYLTEQLQKSVITNCQREIETKVTQKLSKMIEV